MTVSNHTSAVFRESPKPEATIAETVAEKIFHEALKSCKALKSTEKLYCEHRLFQCGGCGKYSHKLFLNPRLPAETQQCAGLTLPVDTVDTQVDNSQGVDWRVDTDHSQGGH